jgi:hypothetical protein
VVYDHDGSLVSTENVDIVATGTWEDAKGVNTPKFYKRVRSGELLPYTPWEQYIRQLAQTSSCSLGFTTSELRQEYTGWNVPVPNYSTFGSEDISEVMSRAPDASLYVAKAAASIYNRGWDGLTFIAELRKTASMFRKTLTRASGLWDVVEEKWLANSLREKKLSQKQLATFAKDATDFWLEGRYGYRTLVFDLQDLNDAIRNLSEKRSRHQQRAGTTIRGELDNAYGVEYWGSAGTVTWKCTKRYTCSVRGNVIADIEPPVVSVNPVVTAWELIPLSFIIDWVYDIGTWLETMSFSLLAKQHFACTGYHIRLENTYEVDEIVEFPGWWLSREGHAVQTVDYTHRVPSSVPNTPLIHTDLFQDPLKVVDLMQILRRKLRVPKPRR